MRITRTYLIITLFILLASMGSNVALAQTGIDSIEIVEPLPVDSFYSDYEDYEEEETYEDSTKRAKANAFDTMDTLAMTTISWRKLDSNYIEGLKNSPDFEYVKTGLSEPDKKTVKPRRGIDLGKIWLYIAIVLFILILIWYLKDNNLLLFRKKATSIETGSYEEEQKDIFSIQFADAIQEALKANNYRLAIRLQYLQLLKTLSEKGIIKYQPDKTNFDYLLQTKSTSHYEDFLSATRSYEYSWYGLFPIDEDSYRNIENSFTDLYKKIKA